MPAICLPDLDRLRQLPERGSLVLLAVAIDLADSALRIEHPCLDLQPPDADHLPPTTELLAELLLARFAELHTLVARYNAAVDDALGARDCDDYDDIPF
jgi:hypothetical protein